jgi:hypothetical protein
MPDDEQHTGVQGQRPLPRILCNQQAMCFETIQLPAAGQGKAGTVPRTVRPLACRSHESVFKPPRIPARGCGVGAFEALCEECPAPSRFGRVPRRLPMPGATPREARVLIPESPPFPHSRVGPLGSFKPFPDRVPCPSRTAAERHGRVKRSRKTASRMDRGIAVKAVPAFVSRPVTA